MTATAPAPAPVTEGALLVEMRNIRVSFGGVRAVDDVSIDLKSGEVIGLVGDRKSTRLNSSHRT